MRFPYWESEATRAHEHAHALAHPHERTRAQRNCFVTASQYYVIRTLLVLNTLLHFLKATFHLLQVKRNDWSTNMAFDMLTFSSLGYSWHMANSLAWRILQPGVFSSLGYSWHMANSLAWGIPGTWRIPFMSCVLHFSTSFVITNCLIKHKKSNCSVVVVSMTMKFMNEIRVIYIHKILIISQFRQFNVVYFKKNPVEERLLSIV